MANETTFKPGDRVCIGNPELARNRGRIVELQYHGKVALVKPERGAAIPVPVKSVQPLSEEYDPWV